MTSIFELAEQEQSREDEQLAFFSSIEESKQSSNVEEDEPGLIRSLISAPIRGALKTGLAIFGQSALPVEEVGVESPTIAQQEAQLESLLPVQDNFITRTLERGGQLAAPLPGAALARVPQAAVAGQTVKEFGGSPLLQAGAEILAFGRPKFTDELKPSKKQSELIEKARGLGLTEKEIAPLTNSEKAKRFLGKFSAKGENIQKKVEESKKAVGRVYENIKSSEAASKSPSAKAVDKMLDEMNDIIFNKTSVKERKLIAEEFSEFINRPVTGESQMTLWQRLNKSLGPKSSTLQLIREPLKNSIKATDKTLFKDFQTANRLYSEYASISNRLKPGSAEAFLEASAGPRFLFGLFTGNHGMVAEVVGETVVRQLAGQILTNPKFKDLGRKMVMSINENKIQAAISIARQYAKEVEKTDPDAAALLRKITAKDFQALLSSQEEEEK